MRLGSQKGDTDESGLEGRQVDSLQFGAHS